MINIIMQYFIFLRCNLCGHIASWQEMLTHLKSLHPKELQLEVSSLVSGRVVEDPENSIKKVDLAPYQVKVVLERVTKCWYCQELGCTTAHLALSDSD